MGGVRVVFGYRPFFDRRNRLSWEEDTEMVLVSYEGRKQGVKREISGV
jgi:hypothetical protein